MSLLQLFRDPLGLAWGTQGFQIITEKGTECEHLGGDWGHAGGRRGTGYPGCSLCLFFLVESSPQLLLKASRLFYCCQSGVSRDLSHKKFAEKK